MFTGIVQGTAKVVSIDDKPNFRTHVVELPAHMLEGLETGASVANNGCFLTVTEINGARISRAQAAPIPVPPPVITTTLAIRTLL